MINSSEYLNYTTSNSSIPEIQVPSVGIKNSVLIAVIITLYTLVFIPGIIGNTCFCTVVLARKKVRTVTNVLLFNLAVADLVILCVNLPFTVVVTITHLYPFGLVMCKIQTFSQTLAVLAESFTIVAISCDRYRAIVFPLKSKLSLRIAKIVIACSWIVAAPFAIVLLNFTTIVHIEMTGDFCLEVWNNDSSRRTFTLIMFLSCLVVPLIICIYFYAAISMTLIKSKKFLKNNDKSSRILRRRRIAAVKCGVVMGLYFICWLPSYLFVILTDYGFNMIQDETTYSMVYATINWIGYINSCCNPIIYSFFNDSYRSALYSVFGRGNRVARKTSLHESSANSVRRHATIKRDTITTYQASNNCAVTFLDQEEI